MDPSACFEMLRDAMEYGDDTVAANAAEDLTDWIKRGGFVPDEVTLLALLDLIRRSALSRSEW
jgi:hypothetical protein